MASKKRTTRLPSIDRLTEALTLIATVNPGAADHLANGFYDAIAREDALRRMMGLPPKLPQEWKPRLVGA